MVLFKVEESFWGWQGPTENYRAVCPALRVKIKGEISKRNIKITSRTGAVNYPWRDKEEKRLS